jgi:hypothetical protein
MLLSVEQQTNYICTRELKNTSTKLLSYNIVLLDPALFSEEQQMNYTGTRKLKVFLNSYAKMRYCRLNSETEIDRINIKLR